MAHVRLVNKLRAHEIRGKVLKWIKRFLHNRKQKVVINGVESEKDLGVTFESILRFC